MATLEQVEKLREKANVSFEEAKAALDACNGDMLDAVIYLERQGKVSSPAGGGFFSSANASNEQKEAQGEGRGDNRKCGSFREAMRRLGHFCAVGFNKGNSNYLEAEKDGKVVLACPVTVFVLLLLLFFWVVVPFIVISLFFGLRYRFTGEDLGRESVNKVMGSVSDKAEDIKKSFQSEK
ncbi:hypothetical protein SDC9_81271 [bioreactor metagenome]|uniref:DUF4342 domain-containing protein n=1 Tax=bioreactor metagenome TaxID=1076179 RepID=A0A644Z9X7_9ZZZZ